MFFLVDAFTEIPFRGNPAGVCLVDEFLSLQMMQKIAGFFRFPDLCFVKQTSKSNRFAIKWFSPLDQSPICIHATIAASHIIFSNKLCVNDSIELINNENIFLSKIFNDTVSITIPLIKIYKNSDCNVKNLIGIDEYAETYEDDYVYVIVLKTYEDIVTLTPNFGEIKKIGKRAIVVTAPGLGDFDFCIRYFAPKVGVYEDQACGSASCRVAPYWSKILGKTELTSFYPSKRSGIARLAVNKNTVDISGRAITMAKFL
ncbi:MAG: PhzF family phenazine biosynthesis protein [Holosporales bacterium]|jgi:PhzF family phenazine biosynthesis protein|nr:PhzF family phenazine biosynthesis protein [Holosporales bacterium]